MDIDFTCRDPTMTIPYPGEGSNLWYPVELNRISATVTEKHRYIIDNKWYIMPLDVNWTPNQDLPNAFTFSIPDDAGRQWQKVVTGSDKPWSDIVLLKVLSNTRVGQGRVKDVVKDWSIDFLAEQRFTLLNFQTATETVMHELTHTIAMGVGNEIGV